MKKQTACPVCRGRGTITVITGDRNDICGVKNETCLSCGGTGMNEENMTNADHIRAMSDEELAEYFARLIDEANSGSVIYSNEPYDWLEYLQEPVKEDS